MNARVRAGLRRLLLVALLPLLYLPLRAAESPPPAAQEPPAAPQEDEAKEGEAQESAPAPPATPPPAQDAAQELEQVSLDNNLSFPVDI